MTLQLRYRARSETGPVRKNNQDSGFASPTLLVVADGMGGAAAGDLASAVAVDTVSRADGEVSGATMLDVLREAIHRADDRLADLIRRDHQLEGMGTTLTGAFFDGDELGLAHIGDSRAYLLRGGELRRLTRDHSWVQSLVDDGKIGEDEAAVHPHRSLLLRVLNGHVPNDPDLSIVPLEVGDRLLLCSDGVCGLVDDPDIAAALRTADLDAATDRLVDAALAEGGIDNITLIVADVVPEDGTTQAVVLGAAAELSGTAGAGRVAGQEDTVPVAGSLPAVGDAVGATASADEEDEARYDPQVPHRRRLLRPLVGLLVVALVAAAGLGAAFAWTRTQFFVGASADQVAIFRGLSDNVPGVQLSTLYEVQPLRLSDLPPFYADQVRATIEVPSLARARSTVAELTETAQRCATAGGAGTARPGASTTPAATARAQPTVTLSAQPTETLSAEPTVTLSARPPADTSTTPAAPSARPSGSPGTEGC